MQVVGLVTLAYCAVSHIVLYQSLVTGNLKIGPKALQGALDPLMACVMRLSKEIRHNR